MNTARRLAAWLLLVVLVAVALIDFRTAAGGLLGIVQFLWMSSLKPFLAMPLVAALTALLVSRSRGASVDSSIVTVVVTVVVAIAAMWLVVLGMTLFVVWALSQGPASLF